MQITSDKKTELELSLGWIPYWNMLPFYKELNRKAHGPIKLLNGHPAQVNSWLSDGQVKIAPCSSVCLLTNPNSEIAVPMGVTSDGPVQSVYLGFQHEHEAVFDFMEERCRQTRELFKRSTAGSGFDVRKISKFMWQATDVMPAPAQELIPRIKMSSASATSSLLTQILYKMWFGPEAYSQNCERDSSTYSSKVPIELVIGDEALIRRNSFHKVMDLGTVWKIMTGLPFVFAVWQSRGEFINGWRRTIQECGELAEAKMKVEPSTYYPDIMPVDSTGHQVNLASYWNHINYKLGPREFRGLALFLSLARDLKPSAASESTLVKLLRWQNLGVHGNIPTIS